MTVILSSNFPDLILLTVDSIVTEIYNAGEETKYNTGRKAYQFQGIGCVATWGARNANRIGEYLQHQNIRPETHTITALAELVNKYLLEIYKPEEIGLDDVGYHVAGFDQNGKARLYHIFWGFQRPRSPNQSSRSYEFQDRSGSVTFLYNGRNELVEPIVLSVIKQVALGQATRFNLSSPYDRVLFHDFAIRFASEITPEVGPPFYTFLITPENKISLLVNKELKQIEKMEVLTKLIKLGYLLDQ